MRGRSWLVVLITGIALAVALAPYGVGAGSPSSPPSAAAGSVASVRWIFHGVTVRPPHKQASKGKTNQKLYTQYGVQTGKSQRTSLGFPDYTLLHVNQTTNLVLRNPHLTQVSSGEVDEVVAPGTNHRVQTASAIASAIGTEFDVRVQKKAVSEGKKHKGEKPKKRFVTVTEVIVREGVVDVRNKQGDVAVRANQQTTVVEGRAPSKPQKVDANAATKWTTSIPPPDIPPGKNVALHDNGGRVLAVSSDSKPKKPAVAHAVTAAGNPWAPKYLIDGLTTTGWSSKQGKKTNQWIRVQLGGGELYKLVAVVIDPAATGGLPAADDLKRFQIWVSTTGTNDTDFQRVMTRKTKQENSLQTFLFKKDVFARYVKLVALNSYGGRSIAIAEFEAVSRAAPVVSPTSTATTTVVPTGTGLPVYTATPGPSPTATLPAGPTITPTVTATPATPIVFPTATASPIPPPPGKRYLATYTLSGSCAGPPIAPEVVYFYQAGSSVAITRSTGESYGGSVNSDYIFQAVNGSKTWQYSGDVITGSPQRVSYQGLTGACPPIYSVSMSPA